MKKNLLILFVIGLIIAGLIFFTSTNDHPKATNGSGGSGGSGVQVGLAGKQAPDFELKDPTGKLVKLSDYHGKTVVLNFWATWCGPCRVEMPWFADLQKQYQSQGVEVVGIAMDENPNPADIARFAKERGVNYTILLGQDSVADAYGGVLGLPITFYIDSTGKIVSRTIGLPANAGEIEGSIKAALNKKTQAQAAENDEEPISPSVGKQAPDFELKTLEGAKVKLSAYRGKGVLLNFWATWCYPCREETPWLVEIQNQYRAQGLQVVGVVIDDSSAEEIKAFAKSYDMNYTILLGKDAVEDAYNVQGLPTSVFIDPAGKVVAQVLGLPDDKAEIETNIKKILTRPATNVVSASLVNP